MALTDEVRLHKANLHGSIAVIIPRQVLRELGLKEGDRVRVKSDSKGRIILKPMR